MKISWPVNVLKVEERHINILDGRDSSGTHIWRRESVGWWAVLETHPHISIKLGEAQPDLKPNDTLLLTLESIP